MRYVAITAVLGLAGVAQHTKFGVSVQPGPIDEIRFEDYTPDSSLKVPETARFPVIDVHTHSGR